MFLRRSAFCALSYCFITIICRDGTFVLQSIPVRPLKVNHLKISGVLSLSMYYMLCRVLEFLVHFMRLFPTDLFGCMLPLHHKWILSIVRFIIWGGMKQLWDLSREMWGTGLDGGRIE